MPQVAIPKPGNDVRAVVLLAVATAFSGCGMPGAPQPPSLNLPTRVADLAAFRAGDQVSLSWTMPTRNTDKLLLKGNITVRICRNESVPAPCSTVTTLQFAPGAAGSFTDALPQPLASGVPRPLTYFVQLTNRNHHSAGSSNSAEVLAGEAPPAISGLTTELRRDGVLLHWTPAPPGFSPVAIRIVRKLLTLPAKKPSQSLLSEPAEPIEQTLLVEPGAHAGQALDTHIRFGNSYEYRLQRVARIPVNGQTLELASTPSQPVRVDAINNFPPAVPYGLAAVATPAENGNAAAVDLNWQPDSDQTLAGYIVYRRDLTAGATSGEWQRISPAQPIIGPGYHDDTVQPGRAYAYSVSAVSQNGRESERSIEAQETVPAP